MLKKWNLAGKQVVFITSVYEEDFMNYANLIIPFQFVGDTILDSAHQISTFFVKASFAYANFPKLEKSESAII